MIKILIISALCAAAGLLFMLATTLFLEIIAALLQSRRRPIMHTCRGTRPRLAVLVPAHNESSGLLPTLTDIQSQLLIGDKLLVVADNCTDDTANIARGTGAEVIERNDTTRIGKGYALDEGLQYLSCDPPEIVIIIDADCRVQDGTVEQLALTCATTGRPAQGVNEVISPTKSFVNHQVAQFAGRVKRWLRPLGLSVLKLPCQLSGTGMAFPFAVACSAGLRSGGSITEDLGGSITEDLKLGLALSSAGYSPIFCRSAHVISEFPASVKGTRTQRERWEQGHINIILKDTVRLILLAIIRRNWQLFALTLDLAVPPLSLLGILIAAMCAITLPAMFLGFSSAPLIISTAAFLEFIIAILLAWMICGRDLLPPSSIFSLITYPVEKIGLYTQILFGEANAQWERTDRKKTE